MQADFLLTADHASVDASGKMNLLGLFNRVQIQGEPHLLPRFFVVAQLSAPVNEFGQTKRVCISLYGDKEVFKMEDNLEVPSPIGSYEVMMPIILEVNGIVVPEGEYNWSVTVNGETKRTLRWTVTLIR